MSSQKQKKFKKTKPSLAEIQRKVASSLQSGETKKNEVILSEYIKANSFSTQYRISLHRNASKRKYLLTLQFIYETTLVALGERAESVLNEYVNTSPSSSYSLIESCRPFSNFIGTKKEISNLPFLKSLAEFEFFIFDFGLLKASGFEKKDDSKKNHICIKSWNWPVLDIRRKLKAGTSIRLELISRKLQKIEFKKKSDSIVMKSLNNSKTGSIKR